MRALAKLMIWAMAAAIALVLASSCAVATPSAFASPGHAYDLTSTSTTSSPTVATAGAGGDPTPSRSSGVAVVGFRSSVATEDVLPTPEVDNPKLQNIVNDLYKGTTNPDAVGNGTTADAVRAETETGQPTGGVFHTMKAEQYSRALSKLIQGGGLSSSDQLVAQSLLDDLQSALGNGP